jgi:hypothetical protein
MTLVIATSYLPSHCEFGIELLKSLGVEDGLDGDESMLPVEELVAGLWSTYAARRSNRYAPVDPATIGRAWELNASSLIVRNAHKVNWGWGIPQALPFLDFWAQLEPDARFALFYTDPSRIIFERTEDGAELDINATLSDELADWFRYNENLLRFCTGQPSRCALINIDAIASNQQHFQDILSEKLLIDSNGCDLPLPDLPELSVVYDLVGVHLRETESDVPRLFQELEALADCGGRWGTNETPKYDLMLREYLKSRNEAIQLQKDRDRITGELKDRERDVVTRQTQIEELQRCLDEAEQDKQALRLEIDRLAAETSQAVTEAKSENDLLQLQLEQIQEELEATLTRSRSDREQHLAIINKMQQTERDLRSELHAAQADLARLFELEQANEKLKRQSAQSSEDQNKLNTLSQENELLRLQLEQVQEELEHQLEFGHRTGTAPETSNADVAFNAEVSANRGLEPVAIDFRKPISGSNWHEAEHDGRWGGPGVRSTLELTALTPGRYLINVKIVAAMNRGIIDGLKLFHDEQELIVRKKFMPDEKGKLANIRRLRARHDKTINAYPVMLTAKLIAAPTKTDVNHLHFVFPQALSPADLGESDYRQLTARVQFVEITPVALAGG